MAPPASDFYCSEAGLARQTELEELSKATARQLSESAGRLQWLCHPENASRVRSIRQTAQTLATYCSGMSEAVNDALLEMRSVSSATDKILEDTLADIREMTRSIAK